MKNRYNSPGIVYAKYLPTEDIPVVGNFSTSPRYRRKHKLKPIYYAKFNIVETDDSMLYTFIDIMRKSSEYLSEKETELVRSLEVGVSIEPYLRDFGYPERFNLTEEQFSILVDNLQEVWEYIFSCGQWKATIINGEYAPGVMALIILYKLITEGYTDKVTDAEKFYNFCVTYAEREYSIPSNREGGNVFARCCFAAEEKIKDVLKNANE